MKTTTTKGVLWEVLAPLVRWPLHSPRRLAGVLLVVLAAVALVSGIRGAVKEPAKSAGRSAATSSAPADAEDTPDREADEAAAERTAVEFVRAWARPDLDQQTWWRGVTATAEESFAQALGSTDPDNVPATRVRGAPQTMHLSGDRAEVSVRTDGPTVLVVLIREDDGWRVVNLLPTGEEPAEPEQPAESESAKGRPT